jgi:hypothetical protein
MKRNFEIVFSISFILIISSSHQLYSQIIRTRAISTNLTELLSNNISVYYEDTKVNIRKFGFEIGYTKAFRWFNKIGIEINDDKYPLLAYNGPVFRLFYMFPVSKSIPDRYIGFEILGKYLYYRNTTFDDFYKEDPVYFTRDENDFVIGAEIKFCKDYYSKSFFHQINWGFGLRYKNRDINTTKTIDYVHTGTRPEGHKNISAFIPTINFGFKIGRLWSK